jgi:hypothetical protein
MLTHEPHVVCDVHSYFSMSLTLSACVPVYTKWFLCLRMSIISTLTFIGKPGNVQEPAWATGLKQGLLKDAAIDIFEIEPITDD